MFNQDTIPEGFLPTQFGLTIPFVENFFPTFQRLHDDSVEISARVTEGCCNAGNMAHGAFLMAQGDFATTKATFEVVGSRNRFTVHLNFTMNFFAAAPLGSWLIASARISKLGESIVYTNCDYFADGALIGHAEAILKSSERRPNAGK